MSNADVRGFAAYDVLDVGFLHHILVHQLLQEVQIIAVLNRNLPTVLPTLRRTARRRRSLLSHLHLVPRGARGCGV